MKSLKNSRRKFIQRSTTKRRLRRLLFVVLLGALFITLLLYYANNSTQGPLHPSILPREDMPDMFVRPTGPRAIILIVSNEITDALCYSVGSAYLSGLPVVVAGYQMPYFAPVSKFDFVESAIKNAGLQPDDVVIVLDSDTVFTGVDINPFLDRFIAQSAATPEELDALAVRQGRAMAPFVATGESGCWVPRLFESAFECKRAFEAVYSKVRKYAAVHPEHEFSLPFDLAPQRYLSSNIVIARVWAYKESHLKAINLTVAHSPSVKFDIGWYCEQSIYTVLYKDLINWEVEQNVLSMPMAERQTARSPYGMRAGFFGVDHTNTLSVVGAVGLLRQSELHNMHWVKYLPLDKPERTNSREMTTLRSISRFVGKLYKQAYATHGREIYTELMVPKWVDGKKTSMKTRLGLTPPLLALKERPIDTVNNEARRTFPVIFHTAGLDKGFIGLEKMEYISMGTRWFIPMVHNARAKCRAMEHLAPMPLFLSKENSIIRDSYHVKCGFRFEEHIKKIKTI